MNNCKVSVIVPVYNVENYLVRCIDSLLNQTLSDIEIILVNDGSPDNSPAICDENAQKDTRIKVFHKKNEGLGMARNSGLELATGEYVAFVDSDDYVDVNMFEKLYSRAIDNKLDTVFCGFNRVDSKFEIYPTVEVECPIFLSNKGDVLEEVLLNMIGSKPSELNDRKYQMSVWHGIYSNELIKRHSIRFESERNFISEDILFHIDYLKYCSNISLIPNSLYYYCDNESSLSNSFRSDRFDQYKVLHQEISNRLKPLFQNDDWILRVDRLFIGYVRRTLLNSFSCLNTKSLSVEIKRISKDLYLKNVLNRYPYYKLPFKYLLFVLLLKYRCSICFKLISILNK